MSQNSSLTFFCLFHSPLPNPLQYMCPFQNLLQFVSTDPGWLQPLILVQCLLQPLTSVWVSWCHGHHGRTHQDSSKPRGRWEKTLPLVALPVIVVAIICVWTALCSLTPTEVADQQTSCIPWSNHTGHSWASCLPWFSQKSCPLTTCLLKHSHTSWSIFLHYGYRDWSKFSHHVYLEATLKLSFCLLSH